MTSTYRDMFAVVAIFLLCQMSGCHSAPLSCEDLVRPLDQMDPHHLEGRWVLVAQNQIPLNLHDPGSMTVYFSNSSETSVYSYTQSNRVRGQCRYLFYNFTIESSTFTHKLDRWFNLTGSFLYTSCPDCLLIGFAVEREGRGVADFYLFSKKRRQLEQKEMEEFMAQMKCLNMPPPKAMDPTSELCPEQRAGGTAAQTDAKTEGQNV